MLEIRSGFVTRARSALSCQANRSPINSSLKRRELLYNKDPPPLRMETVLELSNKEEPESFEVYTRESLDRHEETVSAGPGERERNRGDCRESPSLDR